MSCFRMHAIVNEGRHTQTNQGRARPTVKTFEFEFGITEQRHCLPEAR